MKLLKKKEAIKKEVKKPMINKLMAKNRTSKEKTFITFVKLKENENDQPQWINRILNEYSDIITDELIEYRNDMQFEHKIELTENSIPKKKQYRLTPREIKTMNDQLTELLEKGLIRPSTSPFGAPVVFARK